MVRPALVLLLAVWGCGGKVAQPADPPPPPADDAPAADAPAPGGEGTICRVGERSGQTVEAHPCNEGLRCCYPCGIQGCDSVCMADCGPPRP